MSYTVTMDELTLIAEDASLLEWDSARIVEATDMDHHTAISTNGRSTDHCETTDSTGSRQFDIFCEELMFRSVFHRMCEDVDNAKAAHHGG